MAAGGKMPRSWWARMWLAVLSLLVAVFVVVAPPLRRPDPAARPPAPARLRPAESGSALAGDNPMAGAPQLLTEPVAFPSDPLVALGRLSIPRIGLDTPYYSGVHEEVLVGGPGHWPGTPMVGQVGNAVLSGHRTTHSAPFHDLDRLVTNDEVHVTVGGAEVVYQVFDVSVVSEASYVDAVLFQPPEPANRTLTLFACHPKGQRTQRIVVRARAADAPPPT